MPSKQVATLLFLLVLAWGRPLAFASFSHDDQEAIVANPYVQGDLPWGQALIRDYWHHRGDAGHWRPLASLSLRLDWLLWGPDARGYHLSNLLLHAAVLLAAMCLFHQLWPHAANASFAGLCCFAVHPALCDSVAWISGRTSMLSALGGSLGCLWLQRLLPRGKWPGIALSSGTGLLSALAGKEDGLIFAGIYLVLAARHTGRALGASALGCALALAVWLFLRYLALGSAWPSAPHAPLAGAAIMERLFCGGLALAQALRTLAWPLLPNPSLRAESLFPEFGAGRALLATCMWLAFVVVLVCILWRTLLRRRLSGPEASALLALFACLPWTQWIPAGEIFAPRFLYLPLLCAVPLIASLWQGLAQSGLRGWIGPLVLGLWLGGSWVNAGTYATRASYWRRVLEHDPTHSVAWNALGTAQSDAGLKEAARRSFERAIELWPSYSRPWTNLGALAYAEGLTLEAEELWLRAQSVGPRNPIPLVNLGRLYLEEQCWQEARDHYLRASTLAPGLVAAWTGLAEAEKQLDNQQAAHEALQRALELSPRDKVASGLLRECSAGD